VHIKLYSQITVTSLQRRSGLVPYQYNHILVPTKYIMVSKLYTCTYKVYHSIAWYVEVQEKIRSILQAFVEPIATLPYGNLFSPQKSSPPSTRTKLIHVQRQRMTSFFKFQAPDAQSKDEAINRFLDGIEGQECSGFKDIHGFLNHLPVLNTNNPSHVQQAQGFGLSAWLR
jgi:hypothetical protein